MFTKIKLLILFFAMGFAANAQKFYIGKMKKPAGANTLLAAGTAPITQNIFGPVANVVSYTVPDNSLLTGAGFGYKHMKWNDATSEWGEVWSVNALAWYKNSLDSKPDRFAYGLAAGVSPGLISPSLESPFKILVGIATTDIKSTKNLFGTVGVTMPFNR